MLCRKRYWQCGIRHFIRRRNGTRHHAANGRRTRPESGRFGNAPFGGTCPGSAASRRKRSQRRLDATTRSIGPRERGRALPIVGAQLRDGRQGAEHQRAHRSLAPAQGLRENRSSLTGRTHGAVSAAPKIGATTQTHAGDHHLRAPRSLAQPPTQTPPS